MTTIEARRRRAISIMNSRATPEDIRNHAKNVRMRRDNGFFGKIANSLRNIIQRRDFAARKRQRFYDLCNQYAEQERKVVPCDLCALEVHDNSPIFISSDGRLYRLGSYVDPHQPAPKQRASA